MRASPIRPGNIARMIMTDSTCRTVNAPRRAWSPPAVDRIRPGEAQLGANPVVGEGFFGKGS